MRIKALVFIVAAWAVPAGAFDLYSYWRPPMTGAVGSVAVADDARGVPLNPACLAAGHGFNAYLSTYVPPVDERNVHAYADTIIGGFGYDWRKAVPGDLPDIKASRFSWTYGAPVARWLGAGVGVNRLAASRPFPTSAWTLDGGVLVRPRHFLSLGAAARNLNQPHFLRQVQRRTYVAGVGVKPLGERLTIAGDVGWREGNAAAEVGWRLGADVGVIDGVVLNADVDDAQTFGAGLSVGFPNFGVGYDAVVNENGALNRGNVHASFNLERRRAVGLGGKRFAEVDIDGHLQEAPPGFSLLGGGTSARDILRQLEAARRDRNVEGVIVRVGGIGVNGLSQDIRSEIKRIRAVGKKVYAYLDGVFDPGAYYVAVAADVVALSPQGYFAGTGGYRSLWRYRDLAANFGVEFEYATAGKYKGASSQLFAGPPTERQMEETKAIVDDVYNRFLADAASDRGLDVNRFRELYEGPLLNADECRAARLVDEVARYEEFKDAIAKRGRRDELNAGPIEPAMEWDYGWGEPHTVRVILAEGFINGGKTGRLFPFGPKVLGADTIIAQLEEACRDDDVAAIVLRVNSGGGSGQASDDIYAALGRCRDAGKIVVTSMASVAASGGYMISCAGERIFAQPTTITGSIGVFSQKMVLEKFYEKYGIDEYVVKPHEHADALSPGRRLTDEEMAWVERATRDAYDDFVSTVAEARGLERARVAEIAEGRVYTGAQAKDLGLVDEMGDLEATVAYARAQAGLPADAPVAYVGWEEGFMGRLWRAFGTLVGWDW